MLRLSICSCSCFITSIIAGVAFQAVPAGAATLSLSQTQLILDNFSHTPLSKDSNQTADEVAIAGTGTVNTNVDGTLIFETTPATELNGEFQVQSQGNGERYLGTSTVNSSAFAEFLVEPQQAFSLDFQISATLGNLVDTSIESATALTSIFLTLSGPDQHILQFLTLEASVNTNPLDLIPNDDFAITTSGLISNNTPQFFPGANQEVGLISLSGQLTQNVSQPTLLSLNVTTQNQACVQSPTPTNACIQVPEATSLWALGIFSLMLGGLVRISPNRSLSKVTH